MCQCGTTKYSLQLLKTPIKTAYESYQGDARNIPSRNTGETYPGDVIPGKLKPGTHVQETYPGGTPKRPTAGDLPRRCT